MAQPNTPQNNLDNETGLSGSSTDQVQVIGGTPSEGGGSQVIGGMDIVPGDAGSGEDPSADSAAADREPALSSGSGPDMTTGSDFELSAGQASGMQDTSLTAGAAPPSTNWSETDGRRFILQTTGQTGSNVIVGTSGSDTLVGTSADEVFDGGLGQDTMTGGGGSDRYIFLAGGSVQGAADLITDFRGGSSGDYIDLSGLRFATGPNGAIDLAWGGTQPTAYGVWYEVSGGVTRIYIDTDGSPNAAESVVTLSGSHVLTAADFIGVKQDVMLTASPVSGVNIPATITGKIGDTLTETDSVLTTSGRLVVSDPDSSATFVARSNVNGSNAYGKFSITADGDWTYTTNSAQNQFQAGKTYTDSLTVTTADGTTQVLTITLVGTNDAAVITGDISAQLTETDSALSATGKLNNADVDSASTFVAQTGVAGSYGQFSIDSRGNWSYQAGANNALTAGQTVVDSFTVVTSDGTTQRVTFTLVGTNDAPVFGAPTVTAVTEDVGADSGGFLVARGSISIADADQGQAAFSTTVLPAEGTLGQLTIDATGQYTYSVANASVQSLAAGQTKVETFTLTSADGTTRQVSFTINGADDAPVIGAPSVTTVTEDQDVDAKGFLVAKGSIAIADADQGQGSFSTLVQSAPGNLGTLTLAADGQYTYSVANAATQTLGGGQTRVETFTISTADGTTRDVSFTITGTNDPATIGGVSVRLKETDQPLQTSGQIGVLDIDGPSAFVPQTGVQGTLGQFSIDANGKWTFVAREAFDALNTGDMLTETFVAQAVDGTKTRVVVNIVGTNDAAVLGSAAATLTETDTPLSADGRLSISDADNPAAFVAQTDVAGQYGRFSVDAGGVWHFVANEAFDALKPGESLSERFTVAAADGTTTQVSITILGSNDAAVISGVSLADLTESDAIASAQGQLHISDADSPAQFVPQADVAGRYGHFSVDADGAWRFVANDTFDPLNTGDTLTERFTVVSADGTKAQVTVTITGTNDAAVVSSATVALTETNEPLAAKGQLTISDVDNPATFVAQTDVAGQYGHFSIDANGAWTFVASDAFDSLNSGDTLTETFAVEAADGTKTSVTVSITGTNDAAIVSSATAELTETDEPLSAHGQLSITDVDSPATFVAQTDVAGQYGRFSVDASGAWSFVASDAFDPLNTGDTLTETFTVEATDGTKTSVTVTITGTNDAAVVSSATAELTETDEALGAKGQLTITDVDNPATFFAQTDVAGQYGHFSIDASGAWTFVASDAFDKLNTGDTLSETFTVEATDGTKTSVTVSITGTNDAAVVSSATAELTETDAPLSAQGQLTITDVDNPATFVAQTDVAGQYGHFSVDASGAWTFVAHDAFDQLNAGDTLNETFTVEAADGTKTSVTVSITGTNDAAVVSSATADLVETDEPLSAKGWLSITDVDNPATFVAQTDVAGQYGHFSVDASGAWTFVANDAFDQLNAGDMLNETFTVEAADGTKTSVTVSITGTNDAAVISSATAELTETDAPLSAQGQLTITDVDNPATFVAQSDVAGQYGHFSVDTSGAWTFVASDAFDQLNTGDTLSETFTVEAADGTQTSVTVSITGTNDAAVVGSAAVELVETDEPLSAKGQLSISDVDSPATFVPQSEVAGQFGHFSIDASGAWFFVANDSLDRLNSGDTLTETFAVEAADGTKTSVTVSITGTNDAAIVSSATAALVETDEPLSAQGQLSIDDVDSPATFVAQTNVTGQYGHFSIDASGAWTFVASDAFDKLNTGDTLTETFAVEAADGTKTSVTVSITGTNDAAVISGTATASLTEADGILSASGSISASDVDSDAHFNPIEGDVGDKGYGRFTVDAEGHWSYTTIDALDGLEAGKAYVDTITVTTADGTPQVLSVTITGTNDAATIVASLGALDNTLTEADAVLTTGGRLDAIDVDNEAGFQPLTEVAGSGGYGRFTVGADGTWSYVTDSAHDAFVEGQTYTDTLEVRSLDGTPVTLTVTITGTNDAAVLSSATAELAESDQPLTAEGQLSIEDVDSPATFIAQTDVEGQYGRFSVDEHGAWRFVASDAFDQLNTGDTLTETFTVQAADGTKTTVSVTITGTNDAATLSAATAELTETDAPLGAKGQLTIEDVDSPAAFVTQTDVAGQYGHFSIDASGAWSFVANDAFDRLNTGDTLTETFAVEAADGTQTSVTIRITGTNDAAIVSAATVELAESDVPLMAKGQLAIKDVDSPATFVAQTDVEGRYGHFSVDEHGAWSFVASDAFDKLNTGDTLTETFAVETADGTKTQVTVTISGTNDAAVISGTATASLTETDGVLSASGAISATDVDSDTAFNQLDGEVGDKGYGRFTLDAEGHWSYTTFDALDGLEAGKAYVDTITVTTADGTPQVLSATITGTNDAATIVASLGALDTALTEGDAVLTTGGRLGMTDVDNEDGFQPLTDALGSGGYGRFTVGADGTWSYATTGAHDAFVEGQTYTDTIEVRSLDDTPVTLTVTITGTNDAAVLSAAMAKLAESDKPLTAEGQLSIEDVDSPAAFVAQTDVEGRYGRFSVDTHGAWTFVANDAFDQLNTGDRLTETFTVQAVDGTKTTVSVTITGTNDAAVITGSAQDELVQTQSVLSAGGKLDASDVDSDASFVALDNVAGGSGYGRFSIDADGYWSYTADTAHREFAPGVTYTDTVTVKTTDGTEQVITVRIVGTNEAPVVSAAIEQAVSEDDTSPVVSAFANASDVDENTALKVVDLPEELPAGVHFDAAAQRFTLDLSDPAYQQLQVGQTAVVRVPYGVSDGSVTVPTSVSWTVAGANDAPVIQAAKAVPLTEDDEAVSTLDALAGASDADAGDTLRVLVHADDLPPGVVYDAEGHTFTLDPAAAVFQSLADGETQTVTVHYQVTDGQASTPASLSWTITGTNDAPVITGTLTTLEPATEDKAYTVTLKQLLAGYSDVDASDTLSVVDLRFDHGRVTDNGDGTYTVTPDADYHGPGTLSYQVSDGHTQLAASLTLDVTSVNDDPTTSTITLAAMAEDSGSRVITQADLLASAGDVDNPGSDLRAIELRLAPGSQGELVANADGSWTFTPAADDDSSVAFEYTIVDGQGGSTAGQATLDLTPVDDLSRISGPSSAKLAETDAVLTAGGTLVATDVDGPTSTVPFVAQTGVTGSGGWGSFSIDAEGHWTYTANSAHNAFKAGETYTDTVKVAAADGVEQVITVVITGTNDAAVITGKTSALLTETQQVLQTSGKLGITDVDGQAAFVPQTGLAGSQGYGTLAIAADGTWTYTTGTAHDEFADKQLYTETITVQAADGTPQTITVTIRGSNDAPVVSLSAPHAVTEDDALSTVDALAGASDVDLGTQLRVTDLPTKLPPGVSYDPATSSFTLDPRDPSFQGLAEGQTTTVTVNYGVTDGIVKAATPASVSWTVTGTNDAPVVKPVPALAVTEDTATTIIDLLATSSDADRSDNLDTASVAVQVTGGSWATPVDYAVDNATGQLTLDPRQFDALGDGESVQLTFSYEVVDANGGRTPATAVVNVTGSNDAPIVKPRPTYTISEDASVITDDLLATTRDPDRTDTTLTTANVSVSVVDGNWSAPVTFTVDNATGKLTLDPGQFNALAADQRLGLVISFNADDGHGGSTPALVKVVITGSDDQSVITGVSTARLTETNEVLTTSGQLNVTDVDSPAGFQPMNGVAGSAGYGSFTIDANGAWSYTTTTAHDEFVDGQTYTDTITVKALDGTSQVLSVSILGTSDQSVITGTSTVSLTETDAVLTATGKLTSSNLAFVSQSGVTGDHGYGTFSVGADGTWTYTANTAHDEFVAGQTYTDSFTVATADGTQQVVSVSIEGTNDLPVIQALGGGLDMVVHSPYSGGGAVAVLNSKDGTFSNSSAIALPSSNYSAWAYDSALVDVNNDGKLDLLLPRDGSANTVSLGNGDGTFQVAVALSDGNYNYHYGIAAGDVNGDGKIDVVGSNYNYWGGSVGASLNLGNGDGTFQQATTIQTGVGAQIGITLADVNQDGKLDVIASNWDGSGATVNLGNGDGTFQSAINVTTGGAYHWDVAMGDVNGDGKLDMVVSNSYGQDGASVALGKGDGTFETGTTINTGSNGNHYGLALADVNGDGKLDVVVANTYWYSGAGASVSLGNGDGTFQSAIDVDTGRTDNRDIKVADVNGDGKVDILVTTESDGAYLSLGNGDGTFQAGQQIPGTSGASYTVALGDLNGDGGSSNGQVTEGAAQSTVTGRLGITDADAGEASFRAQSSVAGTYGSFTLTSQGQWTYTLDNSLPATRALGPTDQATETFQAVSADGSVSQAIVVTVVGIQAKAVITGTSTVNLTETDGVLSTSGQLNATDTDSPANFVAQTAVTGSGGYGTFSIDADGAWTYTANSAHDEFAAGQVYTDRLTVTTADGTPQVLTVNITGTNDQAVISGLTSASLTETNAVLTTTGQLTVVDPDNTGFVVQTGVAGSSGYGKFSITAGGTWTYTTNTAHNEFLAGQTYTDSFTATTPDGTKQVVTVTLTGTNDVPVIQAAGGGLDIVASSYYYGGVSFLNQNNGTFSGAVSYTGGSYYYGASYDTALVDVNNDGKLDLLMSRETGNTTVALGNGNGSFQTATTLSDSVSAYHYSITAGDVNEDGKIDVVTGNDSYYYSNYYYYYYYNTANGASLNLGNGDGTFQSATSIYTGSNSQGGVKLVDVNKDGHLDLVAVNLQYSGATVNLGNGNGTFQSPISVSTGGSYQRDVAVGDVNGDGNVDIVASNSNGTYGATVALGNGNGTFQNGTQINTGNYGSHYGVALADVNNDGKLDIVVTNSYSYDGKGASVALGNGDGTFQNPLSVQTSNPSSYYYYGQGVYDVKVADIDGDGKVDIMTTTDNGGVNINLGNGDGTFKTAQLVATGYSSTYSVALGDLNGDGATGTGKVTEGAAASTVTGKLIITDGDAGQSSFAAQTAVQGRYGSFSMASNGSWAYTLDNSRPETIALGDTDKVTETFTVFSSDGTASQDVVVTVTGIGTSTGINGSTGDDTLGGTSASDVMNAGAGNDRLDGGLAADYLTGGTGADTFVFNTAPGVPDTIRDFKSAQGDQIELSLDVFTQLLHDGQGHLTESVYIVGSGTAQSPDQHLVFDPATGLLSYDADGDGSGTAQGIVKLDGVTLLTQDDLKLTGPSGG